MNAFYKDAFSSDDEEESMITEDEKKKDKREEEISSRKGYLNIQSVASDDTH